MGKSSLSKSVVAALQGEGLDIALIEIARDALPSLPGLLTRLRGLSRRFVLFADDLSFEGDYSAAKALRSLLEGGAEARPDNARLYVTSNRRHLVDRSEEHTSELQSLMRISYAVFCLKKKTITSY